MIDASWLSSPLSIAPMIDWSYTHFRVLMRFLAPKALLYTEMQTTGAVLHNPSRALDYYALEQPLALQLGGSEPEALATCAKMAAEAGYAEVNINLGCPSDRVQAGRFGACLMLDPSRVAECISAMKEAVSLPITAKVRIGVDHHEGYDFFASFVHRLMAAGCDKLIVHARKAWLHGLSPKQNRTIPPLHYDYAYDIKTHYPKVPVILNGNINAWDDIQTHLQHVDGVMLGRLACQHPYAIADIHHSLYPTQPLLSRAVILENYIAHALSAHESGSPISLLLKPILNLAHGLSGARVWKAQLMDVQRTNNMEQLKNTASLMMAMELGLQ